MTMRGHPGDARPSPRGPAPPLRPAARWRRRRSEGDCFRLQRLEPLHAQGLARYRKQAVACETDAQCSVTPTLPRCDVDAAYCVSCVGDEDCGGTAHCAGGDCVSFVPCVNSFDCPEGNVCDRDAAECVTCVVDGDCLEGQVCVERTCALSCVSDTDCLGQNQLCHPERAHCVDCEHVDCPEEWEPRGGRAMERSHMDESFWRERWRQAQIGFHEPEPNTLLRRFGERLWPGHDRQADVLVPLCGKSTDLRWLAERGFRVTGIDLVYDAAEAFFREQGMEAQRTAWRGFDVLTGGAVRIFVGNLFDIDVGALGPFDAAYDRAALIALAPEDRARYVAALLTALRVGGKLLLVSFDYDQGKMNGPPFAVGDEEVQRLLAPAGSLEKLADEDVLNREPRFRERGLDRLREGAWLFTHEAGA